MLIREFQIKEYEETLALWKAAGLILRPGDELEGIRLKLQRDSNLFLVAVEGDEIVGVVMGAWDGRRGWINHLSVKPSHQRCGIRRALIGELEKRLLEKGAKKVNAQVYRWNARSLDFFTAVGYVAHADLIMVGKRLKKRDSLHVA